jgi:hypothetical protein
LKNGKIFNRGAMAEQFIGQEMAVSQQGDIFYWARAEKSSSAEVDYIFSCEEKIYGVEVKSSSGGRLKSLNLLLETYPNCDGIIFSTRPYPKGPNDRITYIPLYFAYSATGGKGVFSD